MVEYRQNVTEKALHSSIFYDILQPLQKNTHADIFDGA